MHLKAYLIDFTICLTALTAKMYASITGLVIVDSYWTFDKVAYVSTMLLTGLTTLYRFIKEVRTDRKSKKEKHTEKES